MHGLVEKYNGGPNTLAYIAAPEQFQLKLSNKTFQITCSAFYQSVNVQKFMAMEKYNGSPTAF